MGKIPKGLIRQHDFRQGFVDGRGARAVMSNRWSRIQSGADSSNPDI
jgi:hypothetical protein